MVPIAAPGGAGGREVTHVCAAQRKQRAPPAASAPVDGIEPEPGAPLAPAGALGARHPEMWPAVRPPGELPAAGDLGARRRDLLLADAQRASRGEHAALGAGDGGVV